MELPKRPRGDEYTKPGAYERLRERVNAHARGLHIPTAVVYAFDRRTRILPYVYSSTRMAPAGARSVGAALYDSGLTQTRVVLQQWTPFFRPSKARLEGDPLEMLLVSSMQIHAERAYDLIADGCRAEPRPLIIAGGPKGIYEPWDLFDIRGDRSVSADVVVTGEEFVLIELIEALLQYRGANGTMRDAFYRARREGALENIAGLVYRRDDDPEAPLLSTGIQRLVQDMDEWPHPIIGYRLLERPHWGTGLKSQPLPESRVGRYSPISSLSISHGCKFNCDYCPIPAYNQRTFRHKSGERMVDEMRVLREQLGVKFFFGTDDNYFNSRESVEDMLRIMSRAKVGGQPFRNVIRWGTEATEFDTWRNRDLLPMARKAGLRALWFGIEDLTATLIKKGQSVNKTAELFQHLNDLGICPMPMMMHHDGQPLRSKEGLYGLLNQVRFLREAGAFSLQVTVLTPAVGTRSYEQNFEKQLVFDSVGGRPVLQHQFDGNHVVASSSEQPWRAQLNVLAAYAAFYNPANMMRAVFRPQNHFAGLTAVNQLHGMLSLARTAVRGSWWAYRVARGPIKRAKRVPGPVRPMIDLETSGEASAPAIPEQQQERLVKVAS